MNIDLIAGLLTALTLYSVFITFKFFRVRRELKNLKTHLMMQELTGMCEDMANLFSGLTNSPPKKKEKKDEQVKST